MGLFDSKNNLHYTCTGNRRYGSGNGSEYAIITDTDIRRYFGYTPRSEIERIILREQLLARDRPLRGR